MLKLKSKKIGEILIKKGFISQEQLIKAQNEQRLTQQKLGSIFVKFGYITEKALIETLAEQLEIPHIVLEDYEIEAESLALISNKIAQEHLVLPLFLIGDTLTLAMANPQDISTIDSIRHLTGKQIEPAIASESDIKRAIEQQYEISAEVTKSMDEVIQTLSAESEILEEEIRPIEDLRQMAEDAPVVKLVNMILAQAVRDNASDIHIEPEEDMVMVRFRVDGILREIFTQPKRLQAAIISRLKILAEMDIAENRVPQDGRFRIGLDNREIDLRVSTLPTSYGENVVLRILDKSNVLMKIDDLGFEKDNIERIEHFLSQSYGIILVTGPTGSGKTTTLYSALNRLNSVEKNIITVEDPIEYRIKMIRQSQVNVKAGMTFATGLKAILRQDPDIIMVGEIRDSETANIAVQAALTGHLVLSTLHTNDAVGSLSRMEEMGIESFLLATATIGVIGQRLVRKICLKCKKEFKPGATLLKRIGIDSQNKDLKFYKGEGCIACKESGYKGRLGIYEILKVDDKLKELIIANASAEKLRIAAIDGGMTTLKEDGLIKCVKGITTIEEVMRVTNID